MKVKVHFLIFLMCLISCSGQQNEAASEGRASSSLPSDRGKPIVYYRHDKGSGDVLVYLRPDINFDITFTLFGLWRYDPSLKKWQVVPLPEVSSGTAFKLGPTSGSRSLPLAKVLSDEITSAAPLKGPPLSIGLYYAIAVVNGATERSLIFNGPIMCNDVDREPPEGMIGTCIPFPDHAMATSVPDPKELLPE